MKIYNTIYHSSLDWEQVDAVLKLASIKKNIHKHLRVTEDLVLVTNGDNHDPDAFSNALQNAFKTRHIKYFLMRCEYSNYDLLAYKISPAKDKQIREFYRS